MRGTGIAAVVYCALLAGCSAAASGTSTPSAAPAASPTATPDLVAVATRAEAAVAKVQVDTCDDSGTGSGFFIDGRHLVTAAHVVEDAVSVTVELDGASYDAKVTGKDDRADVAVVTLTKGAYGGSPLKLAPSDPKNGAAVAAIGYPGGRALTSTRGSVTATNASVRVVEDDVKRTRMVKTDALVSPGNSGGPLVGLDGLVYGLVHAGQIYSTQFGWAVSPILVADMTRAWLADPQKYAKPHCAQDVPPRTPTTPTGGIHPSSWPVYEYYGPPQFDICQGATYPFQDVISVNIWPDTDVYWAVSSIQASLRALNYGSPTTVDGDYGPMTQSAVMSFQRNKGLVVDGEVGPQTWSALVAAVHYWQGLCP